LCLVLVSEYKGSFRSKEPKTSEEGGINSPAAKSQRHWWACLGNLGLEWIEVVQGVLKCNMN
jgi:hypothetical protein